MLQSLTNGLVHLKPTIKLQTILKLSISPTQLSGIGGVRIMIVMLAELEGGSFSVVRVFESSGTSKTKITARSEA